MGLIKFIVLSFLMLFIVEVSNVSAYESLEQFKQIMPKIVQGRYIDIDLSRQILITFEDGVRVGMFWISSGKKGHKTPAGNFKVYNKQKRAYSKKYKAFMPYWMSINPTGKYGIHELPVNRRGVRGGANALGMPASHGCVRLGVGTAKIVYDWAEIGTPVIVHY